MFCYISLFGILSLFSLCEASCQPGQRIHNVEEPAPLSTPKVNPPREIKRVMWQEALEVMRSMI